MFSFINEKTSEGENKEHIERQHRAFEIGIQQGQYEQRAVDTPNVLSAAPSVSSVATTSTSISTAHFSLSPLNQVMQQEDVIDSSPFTPNGAYSLHYPITPAPFITHFQVLCLRQLLRLALQLFSDGETVEEQRVYQEFSEFFDNSRTLYQTPGNLAAQFDILQSILSRYQQCLPEREDNFLLSLQHILSSFQLFSLPLQGDPAVQQLASIDNVLMRYQVLLDDVRRHYGAAWSEEQAYQRDVLQGLRGVCDTVAHLQSPWFEDVMALRLIPDAERPAQDEIPHQSSASVFSRQSYFLDLCELESQAPRLDQRYRESTLTERPAGVEGTVTFKARIQALGLQRYVRDTWGMMTVLHTGQSAGSIRTESDNAMMHPLARLSLELSLRIVADVGMRCLAQSVRQQELYLLLRDVLTDIYAFYQVKIGFRYKVGQLKRAVDKYAAQLSEPLFDTLITVVGILEVVSHLWDFINSDGENWSAYLTDVVRRCEALFSLEMIRDNLSDSTHQTLAHVFQTLRFVLLLTRQVEQMRETGSFSDWLMQLRQEGQLPPAIEQTLDTLTQAYDDVSFLIQSSQRLRETYPLPVEGGWPEKISWLQRVAQDDAVRSQLVCRLPAALVTALDTSITLNTMLAQYPQDPSYTAQLDWLKNQITVTDSGLQNLSETLLPTVVGESVVPILRATIALFSGEGDRKTHLLTILNGLFSMEHLKGMAHTLLPQLLPYGDVLRDFWRWYQAQPAGLNFQDYIGRLTASIIEAIKADPRLVVRLLPNNIPLIDGLKRMTEIRSWEEGLEVAAELFGANSLYRFIYDIYRKASLGWVLLDALNKVESPLRQRELLREAAQSIRLYLGIPEDSFLAYFFDVLPYFPLIKSMMSQIRAVSLEQGGFSWLGGVLSVIENHPDPEVAEKILVLKARLVSAVSEQVVSVLFPPQTAAEAVEQGISDAPEADELLSDHNFLSDLDKIVVLDKAGTDFLAHRDSEEPWHTVRNIGLGVGLSAGVGMLLWGGYSFYHTQQARRDSAEQQACETEMQTLVSGDGESPAVQTDIEADITGKMKKRELIGKWLSNYSHYRTPGMFLAGGGILVVLGAYGLYRNNRPAELVSLSEEEYQRLQQLESAVTGELVGETLMQHVTVLEDLLALSSEADGSQSKEESVSYQRMEEPVLYELKEEPVSHGPTAMPVALAGLDIYTVTPQKFIRRFDLDGTKSRNANTYRWEIVAGDKEHFHLLMKRSIKPVNVVNKPQAVVDVLEGTLGEALLQLTVTNKAGDSASDTLKIKVEAPQINKIQKIEPAQNQNGLLTLCAGANFEADNYSWELRKEGKALQVSNTNTFAIKTPELLGEYQIVVRATEFHWGATASGEYPFKVWVDEEGKRNITYPMFEKMTSLGDATGYINAEEVLFFSHYSAAVSNCCKEEVMRLLRDNTLKTYGDILKKMDGYLFNLMVKMLSRTNETADNALLLEYLLVRYEINLRLGDYQSPLNLDALVKQLDGDQVNHSRLFNFAQAFMVSDLAIDPILVEALRVAYSGQDSYWQEKRKVWQQSIAYNERELKLTRLEIDEKNRQLTQNESRKNSFRPAASTANFNLPFSTEEEKKRRDEVRGLEDYRIKRAQEFEKAEIAQTNFNVREKDDETLYQVISQQNRPSSMTGKIAQYKAELLQTSLGEKHRMRVMQDLSLLDANWQLYLAADNLASRNEKRRLLINKQLVLHRIKLQRSYDYFFDVVNESAAIFTDYSSQKDFRDILKVAEAAQAIREKTKLVLDGNKYYPLMFEAIIYAMITKGRYGITASSEPLEIFKKYIHDVQHLNPAAEFMIDPPEGVYFYLDLRGNTYFESNREFYDQINLYKDKYSPYESTLLGYFLYSNIKGKLTTNEIILPPKRASYYSLIGTLGGIGYIILSSARVLFIARFNNYLKINLMNESDVNPIEKSITGDIQAIKKHLNYESALREMRREEDVKKRFHDFMLKLDPSCATDGAGVELKENSLSTANGSFVSVLNSMMLGINNLYIDAARKNLFKESNLRLILKSVVPFLDVIMKITEDAQYKLTAEDKITIFMDSVDVLSTLMTLGVATTAALARKSALKGIQMLHSTMSKIQRVAAIVDDVVDMAMLPTMLSGLAYSLQSGQVFEALPPLLLRMVFNRVLNMGINKLTTENTFSGFNALGMMAEGSDYLYGRLKSDWSVKVAESELTLVKEGSYRGTYQQAVTGKKPQQYFIKEEGIYYPVVFDNYAQTLRVGDARFSGDFSYKVAVKMDEYGHWVTHALLPGADEGYVMHSRLSEGNQKAEASHMMHTEDDVGTSSQLLNVEKIYKELNDELFNKYSKREIIKDYVRNPDNRCYDATVEAFVALKNAGYSPKSVGILEFDVAAKQTVNHNVILINKYDVEMIVDVTIKQFDPALNQNMVIQPRDSWEKMFLDFESNKNKNILYKIYETPYKAKTEIGNIPSNTNFADYAIIKNDNYNIMKLTARFRDNFLTELKQKREKLNELQRITKKYDPGKVKKDALAGEKFLDDLAGNLVKNPNYKFSENKKRKAIADKEKYNKFTEIEDLKSDINNLENFEKKVKLMTVSDPNVYVTRSNLSVGEQKAEASHMMHTEDDVKSAPLPETSAGQLSNQPYSVKYFKEFAPIVERNLTPSVVSSNQGGKFNNFFNEKEYTVYKGLDPVSEQFENTYLPQVVPVVKKAFEYSDNIIAQASKKLAIAKKDPVANKALEDYFYGALGTGSKEVVSEAIKRISLIAEKVGNISKCTRENKYSNVNISSSIRMLKPGSSGKIYGDNFTQAELGGKVVAFVFPGDKSNTISINGDMISVGLKDHPAPERYMGFTLLHEKSHLGVYTSDLKYMTKQKKDSANAREINNHFDDALKNNALNGIELDKFVVQVSKVNSKLGIVDDAELYRAAQSDPMLRANMMLSNADYVAAYLIDIAHGRTYDSSEPRLLRLEEYAPASTSAAHIARPVPPPVSIGRRRKVRSTDSNKNNATFNMFLLALLIDLAI